MIWDILCRSILLNTIGLWILNILAVLCGLVLYAYYQNCDPLSTGLVAKPDQVRT